MPLIPLAVLLLFVLALPLILPMALVQRYRLGTARRLGRSWLAAIQVAMMALSAVLFLYLSAITSLWVAGTLRYAVAGIAAGMVLGVIGLSVTRWEVTSRSVYYTPNRWLVLFITIAVTARLLYGFWRAGNAWHSRATSSPWIAEARIAGSLAFGAILLGYYLAYAAGVWIKLRRNRQPA